MSEIITVLEDEAVSYGDIPGVLNIVGVSGRDLSIDILFRDTVLTGYTFTAAVILDSFPLTRTQAMTVTSVDLANGLINVSLTDTETTAIGPVANKQWVLSWVVPITLLTRDVIRGNFQLNRY